MHIVLCQTGAKLLMYNAKALITRHRLKEHNYEHRYRLADCKRS